MGAGLDYRKPGRFHLSGYLLTHEIPAFCLVVSGQRGEDAAPAGIDVN
jgi:hypothetical protein